jgi:hypothetical protein
VASPPLVVARDFAETRVRVPAPSDGVVDVELRAETWSRAGQSAAQGVAVRAVRAIPVDVPAAPR